MTIKKNPYFEILMSFTFNHLSDLKPFMYFVHYGRIYEPSILTLKFLKQFKVFLVISIT